MTLTSGDGIVELLDESLQKRLDAFEVFAEIASTNSYLMREAPPGPGRFRVAVTDNQTAGRGRHGRTWVAPAGSGLCISLARNFEPVPENLPALTLALGIGAIDALASLDITGVQLKWPNDLVVSGAKLAGILTETRGQDGHSLTVVAGLGLNVDLGDLATFARRAGREQPVVDLRRLCERVPDAHVLAAAVVSGMCAACDEFQQFGPGPSVARWRAVDWLRGQQVVVETGQSAVSGVAAGIAADGALLVDTGLDSPTPVMAGTVMIADARKARA